MARRRDFGREGLAGACPPGRPRSRHARHRRPSQPRLILHENRGGRPVAQDGTSLQFGGAALFRLRQTAARSALARGPAPRDADLSERQARRPGRQRQSVPQLGHRPRRPKLAPRSCPSRRSPAGLKENSGIPLGGAAVAVGGGPLNAEFIPGFSELASRRRLLQVGAEGLSRSDVLLIAGVAPETVLGVDLAADDRGASLVPTTAAMSHERK